MINFIKKPIVIISILVIFGLAIGGYFYFGGEKKSTFDIIVAKRADLIQEVSVTGRVDPAQSVELAFEKSGRVVAVYANVGKQVLAGQKLVVLENADLQAQLNQAEANVKSEQARLDGLKVGARPEDIAVSQAASDKAKQDLENFYTSSLNTLSSSYNTIYNAHTTVTTLRNDYFSVADQGGIKVEDNRININNNLVKAKTSIDQAIGTDNIDLAISDSVNYLNSVLTSLQIIRDQCDLGIYYSKVSSTDKTSLDTQKTNINTALADVTTVQSNIASQNIVIEQLNSQLRLKQAGSSDQDIQAQEAKVESVVASVQSIKAQITKTIISAPISGVVTKQNAKIGEIVSANTVIVSLISASQFEIEANIPEADIAKVKLGNIAKVTLDAYGNDVNFDAKVTAIDPAETIIDGVATYKTTFQFTDKDERIKSGMTANIDISTEKRENVIVIPQRAVVTKNGDKIVRILNGEVPKEVKVKIGLRGSDGNIEIIEGLNEGDKVITFFE